MNCCRRRRADGNKRRQKTEIEALINRQGLNLVVSPTGVPHHHNETIEAFRPFSASCLCEAGFSAMNMMSKNTSRLKHWRTSSVCFSNIRPRTRDIVRHHQAQAPH
jgi:hypothetical protein